ncbi:MAG: hypothetical protein HOB63_04755 [Opitutae bacterium]|nr:hypothetical protein [Opitutae bacterium]
MNIEEFFNREVASAREELIRREQEEKSRAVPANKPHASFRPFLQAVRRIESKFEGSTEVDFQFGGHFLRIVLGEDRILEAFPQKKKRIEVVTHFMGYKVRFVTQPIRFIRQFITEFYLRLRIGNFLRYMFSTYEYPPWDVIERRKSFSNAVEAVEYVIRALAEYAAKIEIAAKLRREAAED